MSSDDNFDTVELQPFAHQVGGHNIVLQINQSTICKPYIDREVRFYSHLPEEFRDFTPPYKEFIILGNLLDSYRRPCTMDLKMGTRQHADIATEEKKKLLEERCANSTSSNLGFRINGSQVYKANSNSYTSRDKYFGRQLDVAGVNEELYSFFHDGHRLRSDVIKIIVQKLRSLYHVLSNQKTFCFFSCSLLLLYDSADDTQNDVKNCTNEDEKVVNLFPRDGNHQSDEGESNAKDNFTLTSSIVHSGRRTEKVGCDEFPCKADVRLIDFAHTLLKSDVSDFIEGNEIGLLEGLQNLVKLLESLLLT